VKEAKVFPLSITIHRLVRVTSNTSPRLVADDAIRPSALFPCNRHVAEIHHSGTTGRGIATRTTGLQKWDCWEAKQSELTACAANQQPLRHQ
jgi:hypothetical protein